MTTYRQTREALLLAYTMRWIDDTEFALLYDANSSKNLNLPYWKYEPFDLDQLTDDECKNELSILQKCLQLD